MNSTIAAILLPALTLATTPLLAQVGGEPVPAIGFTLVGDNPVPVQLQLRPRDGTVVGGLWYKRDWQRLIRHGDQMITRDRTDYRGHAIKFLAYRELKADRALANQVTVNATKDLSAQPFALGEFVARAMLFNPTPDDYQLALMVLVPVVANARKVPVVRLAYLRALVAGGKIREAVVTHRNIVEDLRDDVVALADLTRLICDMPDGRPLMLLAKQAMSIVLAHHGAKADTGILTLQYRVLHLLGDTEAAAAAAVRAVQSVPRNRLNGFVWELMTRGPNPGRYSDLALLGAQEMMKSKTLPGHDYDTIALALFRNGRFASAVEYQQKAVAAGNWSSPNYVERLRRYQAALATERATQGKQQTIEPPRGKRPPDRVDTPR